MKKYSIHVNWGGEVAGNKTVVGYPEHIQEHRYPPLATIRPVVEKNTVN